jgi:hypothetical protein
MCTDGEKTVTVEISEELEAKLIEAWHTKKPKREIREELGLTIHILDNIWGKMRKDGRLPNQRRPGFGGRKPGVMERGLRMPSFAALMSLEKTEREKRKAATAELLALLREHHGCNEDKCGRFDIPPALLAVQRNRFGVRNRAR